MKWLVLLSEFGQFGPIKFGESRRTTQLQCIPIQVISSLNRKLAHSVGRSLECACSMTPQLDSHPHNCVETLLSVFYVLLTYQFLSVYLWDWFLNPKHITTKHKNGNYFNEKSKKEKIWQSAPFSYVEFNVLLHLGTWTKAVHYLYLAWEGP